MAERPVAEWARALRRRVSPAVHRVRSWRTALADVAKDGMTLAVHGSRAGSPAADDAPLHVLIVDDLLPDPLFGAGYPRAFEIVQSLLRAGYRVSVYPMASTRADMARMRQLFGDAVHFHAGGGARGLRRLFWRQGAEFDILFISRPTPMRTWVELGWQPPRGGSLPPVVYDAEALLAPRERRRRALFGPAWSDVEYRRMLDAELALIRTADAVTAVGHHDAAEIRAAFAIPVYILPHSIAVRAPTPGFADRRDLLFVGRLTGTSADSPNVDSLVWFLREVMPLLDGLIGTDYRFHVAGRINAPELRSSDRFVLHGVVEDLTPLYDRCRVFVAPTRFAAGIPLKVLEGMGQGIACVATPLLAEQLGANGDALPSGKTPERFADQCRRLYTDAAAWRATRDAAFDYLAENCSPAMFDRVLGEVLNRVASGNPRTTHRVQAAQARIAPFANR